MAKAKTVAKYGWSSGGSYLYPATSISEVAKKVESYGYKPANIKVFELVPVKTVYTPAKLEIAKAKKKS